MSDFDAGLAVGYERGYQAAMDAVAFAKEREAARELVREAQDAGLYDTFVDKSNAFAISA